MEMVSSVISIANFLNMDGNGVQGIDSNRIKYVIPKYQREYKWTQDKVETLISDIDNRDKFLGNLILNKVSDYYEIVDGQQRITTIILILIALFNKTKLSESTQLSEEQQVIKRYLFKNGHYVLENESLGNYIHSNGNELRLQINDDDDIYYQKNNVLNIYNYIENKINELGDISSFQNKVLDCQILVLIGETRGRRHDSIEEIFLDINFKSQLLDVADIFKGYCFKNYDSNSHAELKGQWTEIRKLIKQFEEIGYSNRETCEYLYHYLLSKPETYRIPANISINGKHFLEGKNHTQTKAVLLDMVNYGEHIMAFINSLSSTTYKFENICCDASRYTEDIDNHNILKRMLNYIFMNKSAQYYKLPIFMIIHYLLKDDRLKIAFSYEQLKKMVVNYYAYSFFFINSSKNKNKTAIDQSIFNVLYQIDSANTVAEDVVREITNRTKNLRREHLNEYEHFTKFNEEKAYVVYSLIDNYHAANNSLTTVYYSPIHNIEHLIVHDNRNQTVTWNEPSKQFSFSLKDLLGDTESERRTRTNKYKRSTANYIIMPRELNGQLEHYDIITKIRMINSYYQNREIALPKHMQVFLDFIEHLRSYIALGECLDQAESEDYIKNKYREFVNEYFSEDNQNELYRRIVNELQTSFRN